VNLLKDFRAPSLEMPTNISTIDISLLVDPYRYFSWLFSRLMGQDSTYHIPKYVLYLSFQRKWFLIGSR
jgi:hypothetical protein